MKLTVNGAEAEVDDRFANSPLLWVLRDVLGLRGTKYGCGIGQCAACTVLIDGLNTKSCQTPAERVVGKAVTTVEGATGPVVDAVRDAWHQGNVIQCGYCQPGQTLAATALLTDTPSPDDADINDWMNGNLCRCGTYPRIRKAISRAAETLAAGAGPGELAADPELEMEPLTPEDLADLVHPYLRIHPDGIIVANSNQIEMGQGAHTTLAMIVAAVAPNLGGCSTTAVRIPGRVTSIVNLVRPRIFPGESTRSVPSRPITRYAPGSFGLTPSGTGSCPARAARSPKPALRPLEWRRTPDSILISSAGTPQASAAADASRARAWAAASR